MGAYPIPEIKRVALESVSLTVKVMHDDVKVKYYQGLVSVRRG